MYNGQLNKLQLYEGRWFADLIDQPKLADAWALFPTQIPQVVSWAMGTVDDAWQSSLDFITGGLGNVERVQTPEYTWRVTVTLERPSTIHKSECQNILYPGLQLTPIKLWLTDKWYSPGSILEFDDNQFQAIVVGEPYQDGAYFVYTVIVGNGQSSSYIPADLIQAGNQVSRAGSAYPEYSEQGDILVYNTGFEMKNHLTISRTEYSITGSAYSSVVAISALNPRNGKREYLVADEQQWKAIREHTKRCEYQMVYDQYTATSEGLSNLMGHNGYPITRSAGLLEQIAPSNRRYYTRLTADLIEDFLFDLSYNCLGTRDRKFLGLTGEMGLKEFDRVIKEKAGALPIIDTHFITGNGNSMDLTFGGQFTTYKMTNSIELTLKHFPLYDDVYHHRKLHPLTLKPVESYRITILDIGRRGGRSNIRKVVREGREMVIAIIPGLVSPKGYANGVNSFSANAKDGYSGHILSEYGIMIENPLACGELILSIQ